MAEIITHFISLALFAFFVYVFWKGAESIG